MSSRKKWWIAIGIVGVLVLGLFTKTMLIPGENQNPNVGIQVQIDDLKKQLEDIQSIQLYGGQDLQFRQSVEKVADDFLADKVLDLLWDNYFIYSTLFESLDGWLITDVNGGVAGSATVNGGGVTLTTGPANNDNIRIEKFHTFQDIFSFDKSQRFRTGFELGGTVAHTTVLIVVGDILGGGAISPAYYGFEIVNGVMKGISTPDGTSFTRTNQGETLVADTIYEIQAKLKAKDKIVFYVKKENVDDTFREIGTINSNIPYTGVSTNNVPVFTYKITATEAAAKTIQFSSFEFAQEKVRPPR